MKRYIPFIIFISLFGASSSLAQNYSWGLDELEKVGVNYYVSRSSAISGNAEGVDFSNISKTNQKTGEGALILNGTYQYVDFGNPSSLPSGTAARSLSLWIRTSTTSEKRVAVAYGKDASNQSMFIGQDGTALIAGSYGTGNYFTIDNFWTPDVWHHICLTYDGTTAIVYADGVEVASGAKNWNLVLSRFYLGRNVNQEAYWSGMIDEVRLYAYARSADDVFREVKNSAALAGRWDMENSPYAVKMTVATINPAYTIHSKVGGYALTLNGTDQYASITGNFATGQHERTINVWAKTSSVAAGKRTIVAYGTNSTNQSMFIGQDGTDLIAGSAGNYLTVSNFWATNVWHHLSLTYDGKVAMLYANGVLVASGNKNWSLQASKAYVGRNVNDAEYWHGSVDGLYVFSSYMSARQVQEDYASTPGDAPGNLEATMLSPNKIRLTFTDNSTNETRFLAMRSLTPGTGYEYGSTFPATPNSIDAQLTEGTTYYYIVRAANEISNSDFSSEASATTMANPPTNLEVMTTTANSVYLTWTDNSLIETGYRVERSTSLESGFTQVTTTAANQTRFVDSGLNDGKTYYYRVSAVYAADLLSSYSNQASALTVTAAREAEIVDAMNELAFLYQYDAKGRMKIKQVPGAKPVYMVYDKQDRLVLTQDGNQRSKEIPEWTFTKYDVLNRPVLTGIYKDSQNRDLEAMQIDVNAFYASAPMFETAGAVVHGYTNQSFPSVTAAGDYLTVTYYDHYTHSDSWGGDYAYADLDLQITESLNGLTYEQPAIRFEKVKGQVTASKVKNLDDGTWLKTVSYYDDKYRVVQTVADNQLGDVDRTTMVYDFVGKVLLTKNIHREETTSEQIVARRMEYDHGGRLMNTFHTLNGGDEVLIVANEYNELGQLTTRKLHSEDQGNSFKQHVDYRYNIRGWLTRINDSDVEHVNDNGPADYFGMNLLYNEVDANLGNQAQFNGNISATTWSSGFRVDSSAYSRQLAYSYSYDPMNRLKGASLYYHHDGWNSSLALHEGNLVYDLNGNIKTLRRTDKHGHTMDLLSYEYGTGSTSHSNKLLRVTDSGDANTGFKDGNSTGEDYAYDVNGNMVVDRNKNIDSIGYNHLNLPQFVRKNNGEHIVYGYDATGMKRNQRVYDSLNNLVKTTGYAGEFIYENDTLKFASHEEGRVLLTGIPEYQYHLKDHLGNVRLTFTSKQEVEASKATMESSNTAQEAAQFLNYAEVQKVDTKVFDHTGEGTTFTSMRLMGGNTTEKYGLARSLSVMPGDTIHMEVFAKYLDNDPQNWSSALTNVIAAIAGTANPVGTYVDGGMMGSISGSFPFPGLLERSDEGGTGPKAYLNYLVFDRDFNYMEGGFKRVTTDAKESGATLVPGVNDEGRSHEHLFINDIAITQPGYVYIYLSNENPTPVEVYFDDFSVEHIKSPVVQMDDYYPFGLTFNSYSRENTTSQDYKFNGKELQDELSLGWLDYGARMYMPEIGRWGAIDPLAEKFYPASPYNYAFSNPVNLTDPDGRSAEAVIDEKNKTITVNMVYVFYGSGANDENMKAAIATLNSMWNANAGEDGWSDAGDGWKIQVNATGVVTDEEGAQEMADDNEGNALFNYVRVEEQNNAEGVMDPTTGETDHKVSQQTGNSGFWVTRDMKDTTPAHESGHGLNLSTPWHDNADGIMVPGTNNRKVTPSNLNELKNNVLQGQDKSSLIDKYLFNVKRVNVGSTSTTIYDKDGRAKN